MKMINHFPLAGSGSGTYTKNLAVHLAALGHEVSIVLPENTDSFKRIPGIRLIPVYLTPETAADAEKKHLQRGRSAGKFHEQSACLSIFPALHPTLAPL